MGHVPPGAIREAGQGDDVSRREHRGAGAHDRDLSRRELGALGESIALKFLITHGARPIGRNTRIGRGEIDLHVRFGSTVVVVEVKTLAVRDPGGADPLRSVTLEKTRQLHRLARRLDPAAFRVDGVGVVVHPMGADLRWIRGIG